jgi:Flp pilus assembly pilin Flp
VALAAAAAYVVVKYGGDIVEGIGNAISSVGNAIGNAVSSVGHALDPSNW